MSKAKAAHRAIAASATAAGLVYGVGRVRIQEWLAQMRAEGLNPGKRPLDLIVISGWLATKGLQRPRKSEDPDLSGDASPQLERFRKYKADLARLDLRTRRGEVVRVADIDATLMQFAGVMRGAGELLARHHGESARQILDEALKNAGRIANRLRENVNDSDGGTTPAID